MFYRIQVKDKLTLRIISSLPPSVADWKFWPDPNKKKSSDSDSHPCAIRFRNAAPTQKKIARIHVKNGFSPRHPELIQSMRLLLIFRGLCCPWRCYLKIKILVGIDFQEKFSHSHNVARFTHIGTLSGLKKTDFSVILCTYGRYFTMHYHISRENTFIKYETC
jgi:hypothetical protein